MGIKFTKMHGCGNDFIIIDYDEAKKIGTSIDKKAQELCDRHFGIGADGLIIPNPNVTEADLGWFFYNSDGSTAQMCGNGMRCFAKYVFDCGIVDKTEFSVKTAAGKIQPRILDNGDVMVNMSKPILDSNKIPFKGDKNLNYEITIADKTFTGNAISMGNPHFVIFVDNNEDLAALAKNYGPLIETAPEFPEKTNVEFVKIISRHHIELCVWERGCGITLACGTGACASVAAGILNGLLDNTVEVSLPGGTVSVLWNGSKDTPDWDIFLAGPAKYVFDGELE